jgi:hypothetical protein
LKVVSVEIVAIEDGLIHHRYVRERVNEPTSLRQCAKITEYGFLCSRFA